MKQALKKMFPETKLLSELEVYRTKSSVTLEWDGPDSQNTEYWLYMG